MPFGFLPLHLSAVVAGVDYGTTITVAATLPIGGLSISPIVKTGVDLTVATIPIVGKTISPTVNVPALFGVYNGYAERKPSGARSYLETEAMLGDTVDMVAAFSDHNAPGGWGNGLGSVTNSMEQSAAYNIGQIVGSGKKMMWSQACAMGSGAYSVMSGGSMADVAGGAGASTFAYIGAQLVANGFADAIIRIGWEHNHTQFPWGNPWTDQNTHATAYIAAFRAVADAFRAVSGNSFTIAWTPNKCKPGHPSSRVDIAYPGDAYVDYVGLDAYDDHLEWMEPTGYGANASETLQQRWDDVMLGNTDPDAYNGGGRLNWLVAFATAHSKPIVIGEWAAGGPTSIQNYDVDRPMELQWSYAGGDDPTYITNFLTWFDANDVYAHIFYDIFDTGIGYTGAICWDASVTGMLRAGYASVSAVAIGTGSKVYTVASSLPFVEGMPLIVRDNASPNGNYIEATVTSYSGTTLTLNGFAAKGTGTPAAVTIQPHPNSHMVDSVNAMRSYFGRSTYTDTPRVVIVPEVDGNLIPFDARNDLTDAYWTWNYSAGSNATLSAGSIVRTSAVDYAEAFRKHTISVVSGSSYTFSFKAKATGTSYNGAVSDGVNYRTWWIHETTGALTFYGGSLADPTYSVGAADGSGYRLVTITFIAGATSSGGSIEWGHGGGSLGTVYGKEFSFGAAAAQEIYADLLPASLPISGLSISPVRAYVASLAVGSLPITGLSFDPSRSYVASLTVASVPITGLSINPLRAYVESLTIGSLPILGLSIDPARAYGEALTVATLPITGLSITPVQSYSEALTAASLPITGLSISPVWARSEELDFATLPITGLSISPLRAYGEVLTVGTIPIGGLSISPVWVRSDDLVASSLPVSGLSISPIRAHIASLLPASLPIGGQVISPISSSTMTAADLPIVGKEISPVWGRGADLSPASMPIEGKTIEPQLATIENTFTISSLPIEGLSINPFQRHSIILAPASMEISGKTFDPIFEDAPGGAIDYGPIAIVPASLPINEPNYIHFSVGLHAQLEVATLEIEGDIIAPQAALHFGNIIERGLLPINGKVIYPIFSGEAPTHPAAILLTM